MATEEALNVQHSLGPFTGRLCPRAITVTVGKVDRESHCLAFFSPLNLEKGCLISDRRLSMRVIPSVHWNCQTS